MLSSAPDRPPQAWPRIACLCPTYGRPTLLANAIACYLSQDYPMDARCMLVLDDAGQLADVDLTHLGVQITSVPERFPNLPLKYNALIKLARLFDPDIWVVWDDDDVYLPWHLKQHALAHLSAVFPKDDTGSVPPVFNRMAQADPVFTDYPGSIILEPSAGRFHGGISIGKHLLRQLGNSWVVTKRADFDQQMIGRCLGISSRVLTSPKEKPGYLFRWGSTQAYHCQALMRTPDDETWYDAYAMSEPGWQGPLVPRFDATTIRYYQQLAPEYPISY